MPTLKFLAKNSETILQNFKDDLNSGTSLDKAQITSINSQEFKNSGKK